ncbi:aminoglycoside phosphotransferase family protein [Paenibacillus thiaminolyticus]|uniref:phosphotransferase family protein n=1 Tax=Paenibacillus thiaminolyticus TaxID=49283 RepID=UPI0011630B91|nr:aminoglycoside phosphotransferase family protein [Paenibacillus thiaminolyticus]NGP60435.1 aminoglycoside phosphotransferase family protein [Paenibacillus thiaminolyticus]WCR25927.1 aminoglycoside phosphotransferase family protein [Paenibacillus thiaminolyticus]
MNRTAEHDLPDCVLAWVAQAVHPQAAVRSIRRLQGGISSLLHQVTLRSPAHDGEIDVVVRLFDNAEWLEDEPDLARHEAECLRQAARIGSLPTPRLVACDETGRECGMPAVLMTRLEGTVVLEPRDTAGWVNGLAEALAQIHAAEPDGFPWNYYTYIDIGAITRQEWSAIPERWDEAIRIAGGPRPDAATRFIHRDYHPANVLWLGGKISGVVDWVNGCLGPAGIDVGHCRLNLAMLHGVQAADAFLSAYIRHAGPEFRYDPYWDLVSLMDILFEPPSVYRGWTDLGVEGLSDRIMRERLDQYAVSLLERA